MRKGFLKKALKKMPAVLLSLCLSAVHTAPVMAAENGYTYTVRFFSGAQGTIDGREMIAQTKLHYGDRVVFNQSRVKLNDGSKYYVKGIRESGKDNNTAGSTTSFLVTGDMDYVVVYGILGNSVAYTVNYTDRDGRELAPSETYYGNVGDRPVLAYQHIEGYQPQAYNLQGTLKENASENVFTFVYTSTSTQAPAAPSAPQATAAPGVLPVVTAAPVPAGTTAPAAQTGEETGDENEEQGEEAGDDTPEEAEEAAEGNAPQELQQIDDEEAPLANMNAGNQSTGNVAADFATRVANLPMAVRIAIISAVLLAGGSAAWLLIRRRRKRAEHE